MKLLPYPTQAFTQLGWRFTSLAQLWLRPHAFFERLYALPWYADTLKDWLHWLQIPASSRILELGCSSGQLSTELAEHAHAVIGLDRSTRAIRFARQRRSRPGLQYMAADALHLPFAQPQFDYTLAASLLNVVIDTGALLTEMLRVTESGGVVSCLFPNPAMQQESAQEFIQAHALHGFSAAALSLWARLANKLETENILAVFRRTGMCDIHHTTFLQGMVSCVRATAKL